VIQPPSRSGIVVFGNVEAGIVRRGDVLLRQHDNTSITVKEIDFPTPKTRQEGSLAILVDPDTGHFLRAGDILIQ
jgi:hypothetical protein